jgi:hypothetical protein
MKIYLNELIIFLLSLITLCIFRKGDVEKYAYHSVDMGHYITRHNLMTSTRTCPLRPKTSASLCQLGILKSCYSLYIAEVLDSIVQFAPMYVLRQDETVLLYEYHKYFASYLASVGIRTITVEALYTAENQVYKLT